MGASTVKNSVIRSELLADEKELIRNFSLSASSTADLHHLLRFLIENRSFLDAGGEKTLIVVGLGFQNPRVLAPNPRMNARFTQSLVERHGLYDYSKSGGISPRPMSSRAR